MNFILFDDERFEELKPFTYTRPVSEIRCGILTLAQKWEHVTGLKPNYHTRTFLQEKYTLQLSDDNLWINSGFRRRILKIFN